MARRNELTEIQREVYETRHANQNESWSETAVRLGRDPSEGGNVSRMYRIACRKLGVACESQQKQKQRNPERMAEFINALADPEDKRNLLRLADETGMGHKGAEQLAERASTSYMTVFKDLERIKTEQLVKGFEHLALRAMGNITQEKLEEASAYHLTLISAIAVDKRELLDGRPTERISFEDRRKMPELMEALLVEAKRRGLTPEINPATQQARLTVPEDVPMRVRQGRARMDEPTDLEQHGHHEPR